MIQAAGYHDDAFILLDKKMKFFPTPETFRQAFLCSERVQYEGVETDRCVLAGRIAKADALLADKPFLANLFYSMTQRAVHFEDAPLLTLLKAWRKKYGSECLAWTPP